MNALMKQSLPFLMVSLLLAACGRQHKPAPLTGDALMQQQLVGKWPSSDSYRTGVTTIAPDGSYVANFTSSNGTVHLEGRYLVKDGFLIDTLTKSSQTNARLSTDRFRIIRMDDRECVVELREGDGSSHSSMRKE